MSSACQSIEQRSEFVDLADHGVVFIIFKLKITSRSEDNWFN